MNGWHCDLQTTTTFASFNSQNTKSRALFSAVPPSTVEMLAALKMATNYPCKAATSAPH